MKPIVLICACGWALCLIAPSPGSAEVIAGGLAALESAPPPVQGQPYVPCRYREVPTPGCIPPDSNDYKLSITNEQIELALDHMIAIDLAAKGMDFWKVKHEAERDVEVMRAAMRATAVGLPHMSRVWSGLDWIDRHYTEDISKERWDEIIAAMARSAQTEFARQSKEPRDWHAIVNEMLRTAVQELKDPHSEFMSGDDYQRRLRDLATGAFPGVGVLLSADRSVDIVFPGSPAEAAGLKSGDRIVQVNGAPASGMEAADISRALEGEAGTNVTLQVERDGRLLAPKSMARKEVRLDTVKFRMISDSVGYLRVSYFTQGMEDRPLSPEILRQLADLQAQGGKLILDLRDNPGGVVGAGSMLASAFLDDGQEIVRFQRKGKIVSRHMAEGIGALSKIPLTVLVDGETASASEIVASSLQDHGRAAVLGGRTWGKATSQAMTGDALSGMKLTESGWCRIGGGTVEPERLPSGRKVEGTGGVVPDRAISMDAQEQERLRRFLFRWMYGAEGAGEWPKDPVLDQAVGRLAAPVCPRSG